MNSENEIKHRLLDVCKVKGWDSDINIVGFHALCDELKALGAAEERERLLQAVEEMRPVQDNPLLQNKPPEFWIRSFKQAIEARGNK